MVATEAREVASETSHTLQNTAAWQHCHPPLLAEFPPRLLKDLKRECARLTKRLPQNHSEREPVSPKLRCAVQLLHLKANRQRGSREQLPKPKLQRGFQQNLRTSRPLHLLAQLRPRKVKLGRDRRFTKPKRLRD
jgi:hypothetical protein